MTSSAEKLILKSLDAVNAQTQNGPSFAFHSKIQKADIFNHRTPLMKEFLQTVAEQYKTDDGYMLETCCGSGFDSALLSSLGFKMVSCDLSDGMVELAKQNKNFLMEDGDSKYADWKICRANVLTLKDDIMSCDLSLPHQYDCVFCVGNSIPFILQDEDLQAAFRNFAAVVKPGGAFVIDHRNFKPMVEKGVVNGRGTTPCVDASKNRCRDAKPFVMFSPGPERQPLSAVIEFITTGGESVYVAYRVLTEEKITNLAKAAFGDNCTIKVLYDLKEPTTENNVDDACWISYIIQKPL